MLNNDIRRMLEFLIKLDELKKVQRQTLLADGSRHENTAEHSWHLAMYVLIFAEYSGLDQAQLVRAFQMALVHDIVEIEAGDTYLYDEAGNALKKQKEEEAALNIFGILPTPLNTSIRKLWDDFEAQDTPEARYVLAMDRASPLFQNIASGGVMWQIRNITLRKVMRKVMPPIQAGCPALAEYLGVLLDDCVRRGILAP